MKIQRTKNAINGTVWGIICRLLNILFPFIIRTIVIKTFGTSYLGLNSLFSSILQVLNLTELGLSSAIVYSMYKPIAEENYKEIGALLLLYKRLYRLIGIVILVFGFICTPFLQFLIKSDYPKNINIYILFILYLFNTSSSYLFLAYKESILSAYQRNDIINRIKLLSFTGLYITQIIVLTLLRNYYLYTLLMIIFTLLRNYLIAIFVDKMYPNIIVGGLITPDSKRHIKNVTLGAAIGKVCSATRGTCDHIIISAFLGLTVLAIFDNYYYILSAIISLLYVFEQSLVAGVGNSIETETVEKNFSDFTAINFLFMWIVSFCSSCLICMYQPFMQLWMGQDLLISTSSMFIFVLYFYSYALSSIPSVYANAKGLWWKMKSKSLMEVFLNLVFNFIFVKIWSLQGILFATIITLIFISNGWCAIVLFKNYFKKYSVFFLYIKQLQYFAVSLMGGISSFVVCEHFKVNNPLLKLILYFLICLVLSNSIYLLVFHKTDEFKRGMSILKKCKY